MGMTLHALVDPQVDDANVILLGKSAINRRQESPAYSPSLLYSGANVEQLRPDLKVCIEPYAVLIEATRDPW